MGGCMGQWVGSGQMTNLIKLELINIIWFCLKIYNLLRDPYLWVDGWVNGWAHVKPLKSNKSWPDRDNLIMDILDILLDILLKPPQPFIGLFFVHLRRTILWIATQLLWTLLLGLPVNEPGCVDVTPIIWCTNNILISHCVYNMGHALLYLWHIIQSCCNIPSYAMLLRYLCVWYGKFMPVVMMFVTISFCLTFSTK